MVRARAVLDLADALDADLERRGGTPLLRDLELPLVGVLAEWSAPASPPTPTTSARSRRTSAAR